MYVLAADINRSGSAVDLRVLPRTVAAAADVRHGFSYSTQVAGNSMVTCNLACGMRHVARKRQLQQQSSHKLCSDIVEGQQHGTCKCQAIALLLTPPPPPLYTQLISSKCGGAMQWQQLQIMTNTASGKSSSAHGKNFKIRIKTTAPWGKLYKQVAHAVCRSCCLSLYPSLSPLLSL